LVVSFLRVGQGDATLLQRDDTAVLVDTGPPGGPILRELRAAGVGRLDALVLTHAQADHEGMADAVLREHPARLVLNGGAGGESPVQRGLPGWAARSGARLEPARAGQTIRFGPLELRVLWPPPADAAAAAAAGDPNDRAVVADVRLGGFDLLLPADAESGVTGLLDLPEVDAVKVAHHGSADPGLARELARLRPRFAAIEVGAGNTYGHPAPSTLAALRSVPAVVRTDRDGTVRLRVRDGRMRVEREG
jgi:competence protein ComEC